MTFRVSKATQRWVTGTACALFVAVSACNTGTDVDFVEQPPPVRPQPPTLSPDTAETYEDTPVDIVVNVTDPDSDDVVISVANVPESGTLEVIDPAGLITYTPASDFHGVDEFVLVASDGELESEPARFVVNVLPVNDAPLARAQAATVSINGSIALQLEASDPDGDVLGYEIVVPPVSGSVTRLDALTGAATYQPVADFVGSDTFSFRVTDGTETSDAALVSITISGDQPSIEVATPDVVTLEDESVEIPLVADNAAGDVNFAVVELPLHGALNVDGDVAVYVPNPDFYGTDQFRVTASDERGTSAATSIGIDVTPVNDPPVAFDVLLSAVEDQVTSFSGVFVPTDVDSDEITIEVVDDPMGTLSNFANAGFDYEPPENFVGLDTFTWQAVDSHGAVSNTATVQVDVGGTNDAPTALPAATATDEDTPVVIALAASDPDGDPLQYFVSRLPEHGLVQVLGGVATYTPNPDFNGTDSFTYYVRDFTENSNEAEVDVTVTPVNDRPVVADVTASVSTGESVVVNLVGSDVETPSAELSYLVVDPPDFGNVDPIVDSELTYSAPMSQSGSVVIGYVAVDGGALQSIPGTVTIDVFPGNPPPVVEETYRLTTSVDNDDASLTLTAVDDDAINWSVVRQPDEGYVEVDGDTLLFVRDGASAGVQTARVVAFDGTSYSEVAAVIIVVESVDPAPGQSVLMGQIHQCGRYAGSNTVYRVSSDLLSTGDGVCLDIAGENVVVTSLSGRRTISTSFANQVGIRVLGNNVWLSGLNIANFATGIEIDSRNVYIDNVTVTNAGTGVLSRGGDGVVSIADSSLSTNVTAVANEGPVQLRISRVDINSSLWGVRSAGTLSEWYQDNNISASTGLELTRARSVTLVGNVFSGAGTAIDSAGDCNVFGYDNTFLVGTVLRIRNSGGLAHFHYGNVGVAELVRVGEAALLHRVVYRDSWRGLRLLDAEANEVEVEGWVDVLSVEQGTLLPEATVSGSVEGVLASTPFSTDASGFGAVIVPVQLNEQSEGLVTIGANGPSTSSDPRGRHLDVLEID